MGKKKSKKKKKGKPSSYKIWIAFGTFFHILVYLFYNKTLYNSSLFWGSFFICGLVSVVFIVKKYKIVETKISKKHKGVKSGFQMFLIFFILICGAAMVFGNVINGTLLSINYLGKNSLFHNAEHQIEKITKHRKSRKKYVPKVYFKKDEKLESIYLSEPFNNAINYTDYKTVKLSFQKGFLGFDIIQKCELNK